MTDRTTTRLLDTLRPTRRQLLGGAVGAASAAVVTACSTAPTDVGGGGPQGGSGGGQTGGGTSGGTGPLTWWDQFAPLEDLQRATFDRFTAGGGPTVEHTVYNPNDQGQALQLAYSSQQMPDVFTLAGVGVTPSVLLGQGWFSPLAGADEVRAAVPEGALIQGLHSFGEDLYSFPIFSNRQYDSLLWFSRSALEGAGLDPESPPASWDDVRAAARAVQDSGTSGLILPLQFADRMATFVLELAQTAGFPGATQGGANGVDLGTGEYRFHDDAVVEAIEFLVSFQTDGLLFPASSSLDARAGRARWAAGGAGFFLDGPYCPGVVVREFDAFAEQLGVGAVPTPDGAPPVLNRTPVGGTFWVSGQSDQVDQAGELMALLLGEEYQAGLAEAMDQPPLDLTSVAGSGAHPTYKRAIEMFAEQVFVAPTPQARPGVTDVEAAMGAVEPGLGPIIQGAFTGQVPDVRAALRELSDKYTAAREEAVAEVGGEVSVESWAFPDWQPGTDFDASGYAR
ncbi:ABC transporter substrate-binding protein [Auraticoccus monumenti]|uniref:Multiple sugar transport system substrate-binding protein n=1 Tax=Auraticoccus monumenti TaxID=675864 RepID=A0A1G6THJ8_9ACTN|nr:extracellular solute-binding protein [Auraticoccus monumenti]SDD27986.1 multiple sugar transport system substrate-binding protein [Auraticoccus monumenti]